MQNNVLTEARKISPVSTPSGAIPLNKNISFLLQLQALEIKVSLSFSN
jgi:hypothetical protein